MFDDFELKIKSDTYKSHFTIQTMKTYIQNGDSYSLSTSGLIRN